MISDIEINNFKSIKSAKIELGKSQHINRRERRRKEQLTRSNCSCQRLNNEKIRQRISRFQRNSRSRTKAHAIRFIRHIAKNIEIKITDSSGELAELELSVDDSPYPKWKSQIQISRGDITGTDAVDIIQNAAMSFIKRSDIKSDVIISELRKTRK
jgi:hypothetical protein